MNQKVSPKDPILIDPTSDFGFKRIFQDEEIMIAFLNSLFKGTCEIKEVEYKDKEKQASIKNGHLAVYDLYCITNDGKRLIIEMQNKFHKGLIDRTLFYAAREISSQEVDEERWRYDVDPVVCIMISNFSFSNLNNLRTDVTLQTEDEIHLRVTDKLRFIYLQLPRFDKAPVDCNDEIECWLYNLKHMTDMETLEFKERIPAFNKMEKVGRYANMTEDERIAYQKYMDNERVYHLTIDYAMEQGFEEGKSKGLAKGREEGIAETQRSIAKQLKEKGVDIDIIASSSGLSVEEVEQL